MGTLWDMGVSGAANKVFASYNNNIKNSVKAINAKECHKVYYWYLTFILYN